MNRLLLAGYMGLLSTLSILPDTKNNASSILRKVPDVAQNLLHIPAFGLLAWLWIIALRPYGSAEHQRLLLAVSLTAGFAAISEAAQLVVPGRVPSLGDFLLDLLGIGLGIGLYYQVHFADSLAAVKRLFHAQRTDH